MSAGEFVLFVPGKPVPFRWDQAGQRRYLPPQQRAWMGAIATAAQRKMRGREPFDGPVAVHADFFLPRPAKPKHADPIGRPDATNLYKLAEDALSEAGVWTDDSRVVRVLLTKQYAEEGRSGVSVTVEAW